MRLGFGCAGLMQVATRRGRQRLLGEAFEQGVRHFDVARMYGLGIAEAELGRFARGRRERIAIATKFGIEPPVPAALARLQGPARAVIGRLPSLRSALQRRSAGGEERPLRRYDGGLARASLETSLRGLGTDYVDFLFVHDPGPGDRVDLASVRETCEELVRAGRVRSWGFSGDPEPCLDLVREAGPPAVLQVRDEIFAPVLVSSQTPTIAFGILSEALSRLTAHLADPGRCARWTGIVGRDCASTEILASLLIEDALERNPAGAALFSTTRPERIGPAVAAGRAAAQGAGREALLGFRRCVDEDFGAAQGP